jgi:hypothetical protein
VSARQRSYPTICVGFLSDPQTLFQIAHAVARDAQLSLLLNQTFDQQEVRSIEIVQRRGPDQSSLQTRHPRELFGIGRDERRAKSPCLTGKEDVIRIDESAPATHGN